MANCCFRSARVLAVVGAVSALSTAALGQSLSPTSGGQRLGKNVQPTVKNVAPGMTPAAGKEAMPNPARVNANTNEMAAWKANSANSKVVYPGPVFTPPPAPRGPGATDNCGDAATVGDGTFSYDLNGATNDWAGTCGATGTAQDVWFRYVPAENGIATVSTCGLTTSDTVLTVLDECGGPQLFCVDDACGLQTSIAFPATAGEDYYIRIADFAGGVHAGQISMTTVPGGGGPDSCGEAPTVGEGTFDYDLTGASNDWPGSCGATATAPDTWFRYVPTFTGTAVASTCGLTSGDSVITVLEECGGPEILCLDDFCGLQTEVSFAVVEGEDYYVRLAGFAGGIHAGQVSITELLPCDLTPPGKGTPENEECGTDANGGCNSIPEVFGTISCGEVVNGTAWASGGTRDTDWYQLNLDGPHQITITGQADFPLQLFIIGNACPATIVAAGSSARCQTATVTAIVGGPVRIFAGNTGFDGNPCGAENDYWIQVTECTPVEGPANDQCDTATEIGEGTWDYDLNASTNDWPGSCGATGAAPDVWFRYTPSFTGLAVASTCGLTSGDSVMSVLEECGGPEIICVDDSCGLQQEVTFAVTAGEDYYIRLAGFAGGVHAGQFSVAELPPCNLTPPGKGTPEGEDCGLDTNGGCNSVPEIFSSITCGETVSGVAWASGGTRDTDWYELTLDGPHQVTISGQAQFPLRLFILDGNCPPAVLATTFAGRCETATLTGLVPGTARIFAGNNGFDGNPCGADNNYWLRVDECIPVEGPANDDCADAIDITGVGPHSFDNSLATTDGNADPLCLSFGTDQIANDLWYHWTSDCAAGQEVVLNTCGQTTVDTRLAVYEGDTCVGNIIACNDDSCGLQSQLTFIAGAQGTVYTIRVGSFPGAAGGPGSFTFVCEEPCLGINPDPAGEPEGEDCGLDTNGGCNSTPNAFQDITCDTTVNGTTWADLGNRDTDWYRVTVPASGTVGVTVTTEVPVAIFIINIPNGDCAQLTIPGIGGVADCATGTVSVSGLTPGENAYVFIGPGTPDGGGIFDGYPCGRTPGNDYVATFDIGVPCETPCPCNFNGDKFLNSQDFFDFIACFFTPACADADYNEDGFVNSQDYFDFLGCFFAPPKSCP